MGELVRLEVEGGIGTIRPDRPPMNALNGAVQDELLAAATEATERADVRAVGLYGGPKGFAAGARTNGGATRKRVVAGISGYALGGGCEVALAADFRVAGDNAKLGQPEILLGIIPGA